MSPKRAVPVLAGFVLTTGLVITLAGCGSDSGDDPGSDAAIAVVASTDVWGSVAERVGGDAVSVESLINDASGDPHAHPDRPSDAAALADADVVVYNGGGYDEFFSKLVDSTGVDVPQVNAFELSGHGEEESTDGGDGTGGDGTGGGTEGADGTDGDTGDGTGSTEGGTEGTGGTEGDSGDGTEGTGGTEGGTEGGADHGDQGDGHGDDHGNDHGDEHGNDSADDQADDHADDHGHEHGAVNEHVWYDLPTVRTVADALAEEFTALAPDQGATFTENADTLATELDALLARAAEIGEANPGAKVVATEPVASYLLDAAGLTDATPPEFSEAIEEETDPPLSVVAQTTQLLSDRQVAALINNAQTETAVTNSLKDAANQAGIPVVDVTETLPEGVTDYVEWMTSEVDALAGALNKS